MSTMGKIGYELQALVRRYRRWMAEPKLFEFGFVVAMALIASVLSTTSIIDQGFEMEEEADLRESFAKAVEQSPDVWLEQLEARKGKVSEYEYQLEYQRYRWFARNAPSLAERIRDEKVWGVFKQSSKMVAEQTAQLAVGKIAGKGAQVIGKPAGQAGSEILAKGVATESKVYSAVGRFFGRHGRQLAVGGEVIGETASDLAWETTSALTAKPKDMSLALKKAMEREENRALFKLIENALGQDPDKMMEAALYQEINIIGNAKDYSDEDYAESVRIGARSLRQLTQAGGSPTSIWKDEEELAKWLASKVGRALPEVKKDEEEVHDEIGASKWYVYHTCDLTGWWCHLNYRKMTEKELSYHNDYIILDSYETEQELLDAVCGQISNFYCTGGPTAVSPSGPKGTFAGNIYALNYFLKYDKIGYFECPKTYLGAYKCREPQ